MLGINGFAVVLGRECCIWFFNMLNGMTEGLTSMPNLASIILSVLLLLPAAANCREVSLYDDASEAVVYIDTDDATNIYLWGREPVAYLDGKSIYGFNGSHLRWLKECVIWSNQNFVVGFVQGAINQTTKIELLIKFQKLALRNALQKLSKSSQLTKTNGRSFSWKISGIGKEIECLISESSRTLRVLPLPNRCVSTLSEPYANF